MPDDFKSYFSPCATQEQNLRKALQMPPAEAVDALLQLLEGELAEQRQRRNCWMGVVGTAFFITLVCGAFDLALASFVGLTLFMTLPAYEENTRLRHSDEPMIIAALIRLLPQIKPDNAEPLSPANYGSLYKLLDGTICRYPNALKQAIIEMARRLEDTRALEVIRPYALMNAHTATEKILRNAAKQTLPILRAKAAREKTGTMLLRASAAPVGAETLLHPAQEKPGAMEPQTLLRAASKDGPHP